MTMFSAFTTDLRLADVVETELNKRALIHTSVVKSVVIHENKFPILIQD